MTGLCPSSKPPWVPSPTTTALAAISPPLLLSPHMSHLQMAAPRSSCPSDSCRLGSTGRRIVLLPGARGRRKLARLRVAERPPQRLELGAPHLQRERPGRVGPRASSRSPSPDKAQPSRAGRQSSEAGRTERSKRMRLYSRKGNYKKVHVHGSHPHDRQRPMEGPNNS